MPRNKLAGHLPLADMIQATIADAKEKLAASEDKEKAEKLMKYEKKEHGHIPTPKEEEQEKKSSADGINFSDPDDIEKLASAMDAIAADFLKEADEKNIGGEKPQGGLVLPTASPLAGKQSYKKDSSKSHNVPQTTPEIKAEDNGAAKTVVEDNLKKAPPSTPYPAKGVMKTAAEGVKAMIEAKKKEEEKKEKEKKSEADGLAAKAPKAPAVFHPVGKPTPVKGKAWSPGQGESGGKGKEAATKCSCVGGKMDPNCPEHGAKEKKSAIVSRLEAAALKLHGGEEKVAEFPPKKEEKKKEEKGEKGEKKEGEEKRSSAVDYILGKVAESRQGGLTQDTPSEEGPKPPSDRSNSARSAIESSEAAIKMKKIQGKEPQKKQLSEVLSEPALSKAHDSKLQDNLRNTGQAGVKIAAAKAYLAKIASDPNDPRHEKLKVAIAKKVEEKGKKEKDSNSMMGYGSLPPVGKSGTPSANPM
jgi:hypothetical protein